MRSSEYTYGILVTIAGAACWGISGTCSQYLSSVQGMDPRWITQIRLLAAGIILLLFAYRKEKEKFHRIAHTPKAMLYCIVFGVCGLMFTQFAYSSSIAATNSGTATVLQNLSVILVLLAGCMMKRTLPVRREIIAILSCLAGTFLVATHGSFTKLSISREGLFWGILSAVAAACYILIPQRLMKQWGSILPVGWGMLFGGIGFFFLSRIWRVDIVLRPGGILALTVIILAGTVLAFTLFLAGTALIGPARGNMLGCIEPLTATLTTALFLHTVFTGMDLAGFALILATVFLLAKK